MSGPSGGPAFPSGDNPNVFNKDFCKGMTLRDYFAAKAMTSLMRQSAEALYDGANEAGTSIGVYVARQAYALADAMIDARSE